LKADSTGISVNFGRRFLFLIISHIIGGLGNQMFQFAAARALSIARNSPLLLDTSDFSTYAIHQGFELARVFSCSVKQAEPGDIRAVLDWQSSRFVRRIMMRPSFRLLRSRHFMVEPCFDYCGAVRNVPLPIYLMGYWQSERYFADVEETIRRDFTFRQPLTGRNIKLAQDVGTVNAVSLHVRRGDYTSNPKSLATHGVCSLDYYQAAIRHMVEHLEAPQFFVFSDDMDWVLANLNIGYPCHYVQHNLGAESYNDMRLMSLCKHHIIANSSFSWWGAWLDADPGKVVVAPRKWFANKTAVNDLFPQGWVTL
jgi:hypothetical protein